MCLEREALVAVSLKTHVRRSSEEETCHGLVESTDFDPVQVSFEDRDYE
jgi:hypothetical protein